MAVSSAAPKIMVRRQPAVLVVPAALTPRELKRLSDIDEQHGVRLQIPFIQFYRRNESMAGKDPVQIIRDAIAKALVPYYPFAGRLRELDEGKLAVDCTGEGVLFIEADADVRLKHFGDPLLPPFPCIEELIFDVPGSSGIINTPLLLFQVTRLTCGSFILGLRLNHTMADAQGLTQFLGAVAELARGAQAPAVQPVWERELLEGRNQPQASQQAYPGSDDANCSRSIMFPPPDSMVLRSLFFGRREIAAIRAQLSPQLQKNATNFDVVVGWLWKFRTVALVPDPNEVMALVIAVDARGRRTTTAGAGIPIGYYGNAFAFPMAVSTAGELCKNPLSYAVELVRKAKNEVDMEYMRSTADLLKLRRMRQSPDISIPAGAYFLSDQKKARFNDLDFGWGKPVYGGPAKAVVVPSMPWLTSFLLPFKNADGECSTVVPLSLPGPSMERLVEEMGQLQQPHAL